MDAPSLRRAQTAAGSSAQAALPALMRSWWPGGSHHPPVPKKQSYIQNNTFFEHPQHPLTKMGLRSPIELLKACYCKPRQMAYVIALREKLFIYIYSIDLSI